MVPILLTIILVYEVKTRALLTLITGEKREGGTLETSKDSEHYCDRVVRLADYDQLPAVMLASFPGSGNTYVLFNNLFVEQKILLQLYYCIK